MSVRIINADVMDGLRSLADESVHCVVTSPPYWGLRDYGVDGQIGLEATPAEFVLRLVSVFREVRRVLRKDGTCWVNLGDSYCSTDKWGGGGAGNSGKQTVADDGTVPSWAVRAKKAPIPGLKPKDLVGIPWRFALAMQDDGWWLRQDIIWHKPNPMPESVTDRCTKAHEYVFLLTKSSKYFYDSEAIEEAAAFPGGPNSPQSINSPYGQGFTRTAQAQMRKDNAPSVHGNKPGRGDGGRACNSPDQTHRNKRSVWTISTAPFPEAHFATFPPELPEICIKAGCPVGGTVLDPFSGAGTTCLVADRLQRNGIGIELNPEYAEMSRKRLVKDAPLFAEVTS